MPPTKLKGPRPEEITFDLDQRKDYLTGFHKRKVQRTKAAQELAERRAKEEKRVQRQKIREERKQELQERVKIVDAYMQPAVISTSKGVAAESEDSSEDDEVERPALVEEKVDHEAEYVDEDKYTSVVVEEVAVDRDGFVQANGAGEAQSDESESANKAERPKVKVPSPRKDGKRRWTIEKPKHAASKTKVKPKKFRYESKAERKIERGKQRAKNSKQAAARREK